MEQGDTVRCKLSLMAVADRLAGDAVLLARRLAAIEGRLQGSGTGPAGEGSPSNHCPGDLTSRLERVQRSLDVSLHHAGVICEVIGVFGNRDPDPEDEKGGCPERASNLERKVNEQIMEAMHKQIMEAMHKRGE